MLYISYSHKQLAQFLVLWIKIKINIISYWILQDKYDWPSITQPTDFANFVWYQCINDLVPFFTQKCHLFENSSIMIMAQLPWYICPLPNHASSKRDTQKWDKQVYPDFNTDWILFPKYHDDTGLGECDEKSQNPNLNELITEWTHLLWSSH